MTKSTARTGLPRAAALLTALTLGLAWAQSGFAVAPSSAGTGLGAATVPVVADARVAAVNGIASGSAFDPAARKDIRAFAEPQPQPVPIAAKVKAKTKSQAPAPKVRVAVAPTYSGRNRFWIPSLGMSDRVHLFECSRSREPDNLIYRWGCAGSNNVYILGHAYGVMAPLHDLYASGGLRKGLVAIYADNNGVVHWYKVTSWRVVDPVDAGWAIADQPVPSMTLQTCVGKDGQDRLNVRLVEFKVT